MKWDELNAAEQQRVKRSVKNLHHIIGDVHDAETAITRLKYERVIILWSSHQEGGLTVNWAVNPQKPDDCYLSADETPIPPEQCIVGLYPTVVESLAPFSAVAEADYVLDPELQETYKVHSDHPVLSKVMPWLLSLIVYPEKGNFHPYHAAYEVWKQERLKIERYAPEAFQVLGDAIHNALIKRRDDNHVVMDESFTPGDDIVANKSFTSPRTITKGQRGKVTTQKGTGSNAYLEVEWENGDVAEILPQHVTKVVSRDKTHVVMDESPEVLRLRHLLNRD